MVVCVSALIVNLDNTILNVALPTLVRKLVACQGTANNVPGTVAVISEPSGAINQSISVGETPEGLAVDPSSGNVYVTNYTSNNVSVISAATNTVTATIPVGSNPFGIAIDAATVVSTLPTLQATPCPLLASRQTRS